MSMSPSKPSTRAWCLAVGYGGFAYGVHTIGAKLLLYQQFVWFQLLTHLLSASALTLLLLRAGQTMRLSEMGLLAVTVTGVVIGALGWELIEYLNLIPGLHWWGVGDSLLDLGMDAVGLVAVLVRHRSEVPTPRRALAGTQGRTT